VSEYLAAAAKTLKAPEAIVKRSAEARAKATGAPVDDILKAWSGGQAVVTEAPAPIPPSVPPPAAEDVSPAMTTMPEPVPQVAPIPVPAQAPHEVAVEVDSVPAAPLGLRVRVAGRVGAWTGALLGFVGIVVASSWLLTAASLTGTEGSYVAAVEVSSSRFILGVTLLSAIFGVMVATLSRTVTGWLGRGMALAGKADATVLLGLGLGAVLGAIAGGFLTAGFGRPIEAVPGMVSLPVLPSMTVVLLGGAFLGWLTAALVQVIGVPEGVDPRHAEELAMVRRRLGGALALPVAGALALGLLVLPFALVLIRSNGFAEGGASVVGILTALGILTFAGLSASRPSMKITFGEFLAALAGIGVIILIIVAVLLARRGPAPVEEATEGVEALVRMLLA
jgi:hypothetical protein